ncbi:MAG: 2-oxoacid:acceptor oxidoreductase family protein, partial [bacterium]|nr:2-oxoacid:acceptor oxidoreductase family protein [bacterium]
MVEIRTHGRGGQGAVIASKIIADAAFKVGKYAQSFPQFGVERRGAPVVAFTRIAEKEDELPVRSNIYEPDHLIILDPTLL